MMSNFFYESTYLMKHQLILSIFLSVVFGVSCSTPPRGPYQPRTEADRQPATAERLTLEAATLMDSDPRKAEIMLRDALTDDLFHGPAHNNLGVLLLKQNKLYDAAREFEWASKLMPGHPDPRMNLAFTFERAGHIDDAIKTYTEALEVYPNYLPTLQAFTRCQLRHGQSDERTEGFLQEIALRGETSPWREWAQRQLVQRQTHP